MTTKNDRVVLAQPPGVAWFDVRKLKKMLDEATESEHEALEGSKEPPPSPEPPPTPPTQETPTQPAWQPVTDPCAHLKTPLSRRPKAKTKSEKNRERRAQRAMERVSPYPQIRQKSHKAIQKKLKELFR